ncbi:MAG: cyclopropane-fatty-acyl-phospholipid synthase family protein [Gammaproteobacteria bacterium]|nr:cyclopropane-fatty-acyl-phospholipid synthase family protein [Gammaproteobacteria bacterium]
MANGNDTTFDAQHSDESARPATAAVINGGGLLRKAVLSKLSLISRGEIEIREAGNSLVVGHADEQFPLRVTVEVHDSSLYHDIALNGTIGAAESYMAGKWSVSDLTGIVRIFSANQDVLDSMEDGTARMFGWLFRLGHKLRANSKSRSRKNIRAHYDLGDDLFELFLDPTMSYSSAVYPTPEASLEDAAVHKLDLVCRKLQLQPDDHLLEIGTGWGGLAEHAASHYGCRVTTTTISDNQHAMAEQRIRAAGLEDRVTILKKDYRDLEGHYDKLVSIEMIEAVGHEYMDTYLQVCSERLKPEGRALIQAILMNDRNFDTYINSVDFIQKYIFPGGALPSMSSITSSIKRVTDFQVAHFHDITIDYARTLSDWRERFMSRLLDVRALGYPEEFIRMWEYYLCYCEGGFTERAISTAQIVFDKPLCRLDTP